MVLRNSGFEIGNSEDKVFLCPKHVIESNITLPISASPATHLIHRQWFQIILILRIYIYIFIALVSSSYYITPILPTSFKWLVAFEASRGAGRAVFERRSAMRPIPYALPVNL